MFDPKYYYINLHFLKVRAILKEFPNITLNTITYTNSLFYFA